MVPIPTSAQPVVGPGGVATPAFFRFWAALAKEMDGSSTGWAAAIDAINARVDALSDGFTVRGTGSVLSAGSVASGLITVALVNDAPSPGNTYFYGTGTTGTKGWHEFSSALAHTSNITLTTGTDGVTTIDLADLADAGTGSALLKITRDSKGRVSATHSATTGDLTEGTNLYFTGARVLASTLTGLSTATSTAVTSTDSVIVGIGKLQAQASANATAIAGKEPAISTGTTSQYWRGDKSWRDFATDVRAAVLTGLSTATSAVVAATDTVLGAIGKLQAQITDNLLPKGYIDGLTLSWVSINAVTVKSGAAYVPGATKVVRTDSDMALSGLSLAASTWYHLYVYNNSGTLAAEISSTAPDTPYNGTARTKTGDTSRRYVGSALSDSSGHFYQFSQTGNKVTWWFGNTLGVAPFRALSGGTATTATNVALSGVIPSTSKLAFVRFSNADTAQPVRWSNKDMSGAVGASGTSTAFIYPSSPNSTYTADYPTASDQSISYWFVSTPTSTCSLDVYGFVYER